MNAPLSFFPSIGSVGKKLVASLGAARSNGCSLKEVVPFHMIVGWLETGKALLERQHVERKSPTVNVGIIDLSNTHTY